MPCVSIQATYTHGGVRLISLCHVSPYSYWPLVTLMRQIPGLTRFVFFSSFFFLLLKDFFISHLILFQAFNMSVSAPSHPTTFTVTLHPSLQSYLTYLLRFSDRCLLFNISKLVVSDIHFHTRLNDVRNC